MTNLFELINTLNKMNFFSYSSSFLSFPYQVSYPFLTKYSFMNLSAFRSWRFLLLTLAIYENFAVITLLFTKISSFLSNYYKPLTLLNTKIEVKYHVLLVCSFSLHCSVQVPYWLTYFLTKLKSFKYFLNTQMKKQENSYKISIVHCFQNFQ